MNIAASAPGKVVVSGEYAVLVGAPALAMAIDRRVKCTLRDRSSGDWDFETHGFADVAVHSVASLVDGAALPRTAAAYLCQHVLRQTGSAGIPLDRLPPHLSLDIDSHAGFDGPRKLGVGTSAAVCAALTGALLARCSARQDAFPIALAAHRAAQGGRGSGIDVAASCYGGLIRFVASGARVAQLRWPDGVAFRAIWTGTSADTREHIAQFDTWRANAIPAPLAALRDAAAHVAAAVPDGAEFMRQLHAYALALRSLDETARLGIFGTAHLALTELGDRSGVVYKPCGAGGGDLGIAFALGHDALASFERAARSAGFTQLPLELDEHGISVGVAG